MPHLHESKVKFLKKMAKRGSTAQDMQDEIFRRMSADEKIKIASELWWLGRELTSGKKNYGANRPAKAISKSRRGS